MTQHALHGGLRLEGHKQRSTLKPLRTLGDPTLVVMPLDQHAGTPAAPLVKVGDRVLRGQAIGAPQGEISAWVHASIAGRVTAIEQRSMPYHRDAPSLCVVIENDGSDAAAPAAVVDFQSLDPPSLCAHIAAGGMVGLGGATFPTAPKLERGQRVGNIHLILNGAECEPWISCDDMLMRERSREVLRGASILCHALQATKCSIAIEDDKPAAVRAMRAAQAAGGDDRIDVVTVASIYPAGGENQLITAVTGMEVPSGGLPSDIGIVCHNVGTAAAIAGWVDGGEPLIRRIVTVTGSAVRGPANLEVLIGTPIADLIAECGGYSGAVARLVMGGSMMGLALPDPALPVVKGSNCLIVAQAVDLRARAVEMPCIRCSNCSEVCPAILLPQQLHWFARSNDLPALEAHGLLDCIECGCCDYVCPSQIPLTQRFREAKPALLERFHAREQAQQARARYEARDARLERLEAEQRAKLAEKRKSLLAHPSE